MYIHTYSLALLSSKNTNLLCDMPLLFPFCIQGKSRREVFRNRSPNSLPERKWKDVDIMLDMRLCQFAADWLKVTIYWGLKKYKLCNVFIIIPVVYTYLDFLSLGRTKIGGVWKQWADWCPYQYNIILIGPLQQFHDINLREIS